jgi:hypothetical protein
MAIQSSQLAIIGEKTAYIVDKPGEAPRPLKRGLPERMHAVSRRNCVLTLHTQVLYYHEKKLLHVLDDKGEVCTLPIVAQEALFPEK